MWCNTPAASDHTTLSREAQELVIQRHTPCRQCSCKGARGELDSGLCACAHEHPLPEDEQEFVRRLKVAVRVDELLQDKGRLQDFQFEDEDIQSLRQQMILPRDEGSSPPLHIKRRHVDSASQEPQAKRMKPSSDLGDLPKKLSRYYTAPSVKPSVVEERDGLIQFRVVNNDNAPMSMIILTGLKNIFQKQLPKMPREYIARLIYDRNHLSLAIVRGVSTGKIEVIGGITYRPFNHRRFAEIVFCAIASSEQVRGYGAHLMNHLKDYVKASSPIIHFLTYADNYAIGYFKKQGFTKEINFDRSVWVGYIKDYEGGTIMQCTMLPRIRYLESGDTMARQKAAVLWKIAETSNDHVVYPGIEAFRKGRSIDPVEIPGLKETGWSKEMDEQARKPKRPGHYATLQALLLEMQNSPAAWPFVNPVSREDVPDYYEVIKEPMDLTSMEFKLENDQYENVEQFIYDAKLIFNNCRSYNNETTTYYKNSTKLEKVLRDIIKEKHDEYLNLL